MNRQKNGSQGAFFLIFGFLQGLRHSALLQAKQYFLSLVWTNTPGVCFWIWVLVVAESVSWPGQQSHKRFCSVCKGPQTCRHSGDVDLGENFENGRPASWRGHCGADFLPVQPQLCHLLHHLPKPADWESLQGQPEPNRNHLFKPQRPCKPKCPGHFPKKTLQSSEIIRLTK